MTSPLRRKRRTTAPNTNRATATSAPQPGACLWRGALAAPLASLLVVAGAWASDGAIATSNTARPTVASSSSAKAPVTSLASAATTSKNSKLKWLPPRESEASPAEDESQDEAPVKTAPAKSTASKTTASKPAGSKSIVKKAPTKSGPHSIVRVADRKVHAAQRIATESVEELEPVEAETRLVSNEEAVPPRKLRSAMTARSKPAPTKREQFRGKILRTSSAAREAAIDAEREPRLAMQASELEEPTFSDETSPELAQPDETMPAEQEPMPSTEPLPFDESGEPAEPSSPSILDDSGRGARADEGPRDSCKESETGCAKALRDLKTDVISRISLDITVQGTEGDGFPCECRFEDIAFAGREWAPTCFTWKASGTCHKPLYFEDVHLERYGHSWNPVLQPFLSGAHFFTSVVVLPYKIGLNPPNECMYTLGYYRPGSCAPYMIDPLPLSLRGALLQGAAVTGGVFLFQP